MSETSREMCTSAPNHLGLLPAEVESIQAMVSHSRMKNLPLGDGNGAEPVSECVLCQTYCSLCFARKMSRLARSRFHGRMASFGASGSKAESFEDGDKLRGEAVDKEEDALAKLLS